MKLKQTISLFILLSLFCSPMLMSCDKDDDIIVQSVAQRNAEKILSYGVNKANILFIKSSSLSNNYFFEVQGEFLVIKDSNGGSHFFPLENVISIEYDPNYNSLSIRFNQ